HAISQRGHTGRVRADEIPAQRVAVGSEVDPDAATAIARDDVAEDERPRRDPELTGDVDREEAKRRAVAEGEVSGHVGADEVALDARARRGIAGEVDRALVVARDQVPSSGARSTDQGTAGSVQDQTGAIWDLARAGRVGADEVPLHSRAARSVRNAD